MSCDGPAPTIMPSCGPQNDPDGGNPCRECMKNACCEAWQVCYGSQPRGVCGYGSAVGDAIGEMDCMLLCWYQKRDGVQSDVAILSACAESCGTCEGHIVAASTNEIVGCAYEACAEACFPAP